MAPEQARGEIEGLDERCDVFALGSILCEILTGLPAFTGRSPDEVMHRAAGADLTDARGRLERCGADGDLIRIAYNCLAGDVHARLHDARVLSEWLSSYMNSLQDRTRLAELGRAAEEARAKEARLTASAAKARALAERRARRLTAALILAVVALGCGVFLWSRQQQQERLMHARRLLDQATESRRELAFNLHGLGDVLREKGNLDGSIEAFLWAIRQDPDFAEAHDHLGLALVRRGDRDGAIVEFRQAIRIKPDFADAHYNLGVALGERGDLAESMAEYREAIRIEPDDADAHYNLGFALGRLGRQAEAIAEFRQAIRIKPDSADTHFSLGTTLQDQGKPEEAIAEFPEAKRLRPDTFESPDHSRQRHVHPRGYRPQ
jgi:tetratricopeptide (TPR) repeat protein